MVRLLRPVVCAVIASMILAPILLSGCGVDRRDPLRPIASSRSDASLSRPFAEEGAGTPTPLAASAEAGGFYPLSIGNAWTYDTRFEMTLIDSAGNAFRGPAESHVIDRSLTGTISSLDREYVQETSFQRVPGGPSQILAPVFYRQDRSGLYELDLVPPGTPARPMTSADLRSRRAAAIAASLGGRVSAVSVMNLLDRIDRATGVAFGATAAASHAPTLAGGRPGGVLPDEITRLQYPLRPGQHWVIRGDPLFESTVEAMESVDEPAGRFNGARIRINSDLFGANDRVHTWYGRDGFLKLSAHVEGIATDEAGNVIGRLLSDMSEDLSAIVLVK
ncbi:MAG TPA: hypothetical protein VL123_05260 [Candidatus Udaeobacter sp.]|jgi:hypothetical protein|nr:hypothetical protein [Candidatus Udaeobacter sp.]